MMHLFKVMSRISRFQKIYLSISILAVLAILFGCDNSDEPTNNSSSTVDPLVVCDLVTQAEVEEIIGGTIDEPQKTHNVYDSVNSWMSMCNYYCADKQISTGISLQPHGRSVSGKAAFELYAAELQEQLGDSYVMQEVTGIGDYAGWEETSKQLTIFSGYYMIIVTTISPNLEGNAALEFNKTMARKLLEKL